MNNKITRREFLHLSALGLGSAVIVNAIPGCAFSEFARIRSIPVSDAQFTHAVASGDPLADSVIIWTRAMPIQVNSSGDVIVRFEVAKDSQFKELVVVEHVSTNKERDYTIKVDVTELSSNTKYFYRFISKNSISITGTARTLPIGEVDKVKLLVVSCSYYSAGYFNVYAEAAKVSDANAVLHLGDYIYEYGPGIYADEDAQAMDRVMQPAHEILSVEDYRLRYAQTRSDSDLQDLHASLAMIAVWDDHEVSNDTWRDGAENHSPDEGLYSDRRLAALQAYAEWMPIRPAVINNIDLIQRDFKFGDLVNLSVLDTRLVARDSQLTYSDYTNNTTGAFDGKQFFTDLNNPERSLLGEKQIEKLERSFRLPAKWHVLGQQVLMGDMQLPAPVVSRDLSIQQFQDIQKKSQENPDVLTKQEADILKMPLLPYNLDAWDGYPAERRKLLKAATEQEVNLVVLAGDTHNAWMNELTLDGQKVGIEFATSSVSSPGLEKYVSAEPQDETRIVSAIEGLKYCNMTDRGFMTVTFTHASITSEWTFVDTVKSKDYKVLDSRHYSVSIKI